MKNIVAILALMASFSASASGWEYRTRIDKMTDEIHRSADITSVNSFQFAPENGGEVRVKLVMYNPTRDFLLGTVSAGRAQFDCPYKECTVWVRFDNREQQKFTTSPPNDIFDSYVYIQPKDMARFIEGASKAKRILVQIDIFKAGKKVFEFQTVRPLERGLVAPRAN